LHSFMFAMGMSLWFGVLTSISPCPLATNVAAISYIARRVDRAGSVLVSGFLYMLGRMVTYVTLGAVLISSTQLIPDVANFLQKYMNIALGPVLILLGILLLDILKLSIPGSGGGSGSMQQRVERTGIWGAGLLGVVFALSFCPISAALFFGSLFSLALVHNSAFIMPSLYGIGTAIPVMGFAFLLAFSTQLVGRAFGRISQFEFWARRITALIFIAAGIYYCLQYIFHVI
jgi:cytochrome c-type biogenesis protein